MQTASPQNRSRVRHRAVLRIECGSESWLGESTRELEQVLNKQTMLVEHLPHFEIAEQTR